MARKHIKVLLGSLNVLTIIAAAPWPVFLLMLPFMFDAPGSEANPIVNDLAVAILVYPFPVIVGNILFWQKLPSARLWVLVTFTVVSLLGPLVVVGLYEALDIFCNGSFSCH